MWEVDHKEGWVLKNWWFWSVMLEKTLESLVDWKEIKLVNPKGNQLWLFIGRTDAEAEGPKLWPPDVKSQLTGKDPDAGKDWGQEEKGADEMVGCYPRLNAHDFEQTQIVKYRETWCAAVPGVTKSQAGLNSNNNSNRSDLLLWSSSEKSQPPWEKKC